jgi:hypothetical protein
MSSLTWVPLALPVQLLVIIVHSKRLSNAVPVVNRHCGDVEITCSTGMASLGQESTKPRRGGPKIAQGAAM